MDWRQAVRSLRPFQWDAVETAICLTFPALSPKTWRWRLVESGAFDQLAADLDEATENAPWQPYLPELVARGRLVRAAEDAAQRGEKPMREALYDTLREVPK